MRIALFVVVLFFVSIIPNAWGEEGNFLIESRGLIQKLFSEVYADLGSEARVSGMLKLCDYDDRAKIMDKRISYEMVSLHLINVAKNNYKDEIENYTTEQIMNIFFTVEMMFRGYGYGFYESSKAVIDLNREFFCRESLDSYYQILENNME